MGIILPLAFLIEYWYIILPAFILLAVIGILVEVRKEKERRAYIEAREQAQRQAAERRKQEIQQKEQLRLEEQARKRAEQKLREQQRKQAQIQKEQARKEKELSMPEHRRFIAEQRRLMTDSLRYDILARDGFRCCLCGSSATEGVILHVDHIFPVSKGGKTEPANLRTLCERCNLGKSNKIECAPTQMTVPQTPLTSSYNMPTHFTIDELISQLNTHSIKWIDNRDRGGCLWIELTPESQTLLEHATVDSKPVYRAARSKAFGNNPALFIK